MFLKKCIELENTYTKNDYDLNIAYHFSKFIIELFEPNVEFILRNEQLFIKLNGATISIEDFKYFLQMNVYFDIIQEFKKMYYQHKTVYKLFRDENETKDITFEQAKPHLREYFSELGIEKDPRGNVDEYGWYEYSWFSIVNDKYPKYQSEDLIKCMQLIKAISNKIQYDNILNYIQSKNKFEKINS